MAAWTIGMKNRAEPITTNMLNPGPGTYDSNLPALDRAKRSFGSSKRPEIHPLNKNPGPGTYNSKSFTDLHKFPKNERAVKHIKDKTEKTRTEAPGPGSYNPQYHHRGASYSMGNKTTAPPIPNELGPGAYNVGATRSTTFLRGKRRVKDTQNVYTSHSFSIGKGKRPDLARNHWAPGPGAYDLKDISKQAPKYAIAGKTKPPRGLEPPGPGAYSPNHNSVHASGPTHSFGTGERRVPGPSDVELTGGFSANTSKSGWTFGKKIRFFAVDDDEPGPGQYDIPGTVGIIPKYQLLKDKFSNLQ